MTKLICTAPCVPPCTNEATFKLLNYRSRSILGVNCDVHLRPLLGGPNQDYDKAPLDAEVGEIPSEGNE